MIADTWDFIVSLKILGDFLKAPAPGVKRLTEHLGSHLKEKYVSSPRGCGENLDNMATKG